MDEKRFFEIVEQCGGFYSCPKDTDGKRLGPLVGYAGKDSQGRQKVGDVYVDMATVETYPYLLLELCNSLREKIIFSRLPSPLTFVGMPYGSINMANYLALVGAVNRDRAIFLEKELIEPKTATSREKTRLIFGRHTAEPKARVVIVEDVCNNFSTTEEAVKIIWEADAEVVAVACLLNRSDKDRYQQYTELDGPRLVLDVPVVSLVQKAFPQYEQDDLFVASDVGAGNVVWKPKHERARLREAMAKAEVASQATRALDKGCDPTEGSHCFM